MAYITDAAREYAKKQVKDDKLSDDLYAIVSAKNELLSKIMQMRHEFYDKYEKIIDSILHKYDSDDFDIEERLSVSRDVINEAIEYNYAKMTEQEIRDEVNDIIESFN